MFSRLFKFLVLSGLLWLLLAWLLGRRQLRELVNALAIGLLVGAVVMLALQLL